MTGFQLLAVAIDRMDDPPPPGTIPERGLAGFEVSPLNGARSPSTTWVSVIIGKNGLGKSRTMGAAAALFQGVSSGRVAARNRTDPGFRVTYVCGPDVCELWTSSRGRISASVNGKSCPTDSVPLPSKVIALSTTATDKFPLPTRSKSLDEPRGHLYSYMGLRDRMGRSSATAVVYRALEALVEATEATYERRARISEVFDFLGYTPRVEHTYRWRYGSLLRDGGDLTGLLERNTEGYMGARPLRQLVEKDPSILGDLQRIVSESIAQTSPRKEFRLVADFRNSGSVDLARFRDTQLLKRAGLVALETVELERSGSATKIDLREFSSGELSLVTAFLGLAAVIEDDSLIIIDEPEVSLHPEWQSQYLGLLTTVFSKYRGCHFMVATHSPLVVAGIPSESANVVSLDPNGQRSTEGAEFAGDSVDEVLARAFDVVGKNNLFVKQRLVEALRLAADGELESIEFANAMRPLIQVVSSLEEGSPTKDLIDELLRARESSLQ